VQGSSEGLELIDHLGARTGNWGVYMGGLTSVTDQIYQTVSIPVTAGSPRLEYWRLIRTYEPDETAYDEMRCVIWGASGDVLAFCGEFSNADESENWKRQTYDMSEFKGQTVDVGFKAFNDELYYTQFFVDDVSLSVSSTASAQAHSATGDAVPNTRWWRRSEFPGLPASGRHVYREAVRRAFRPE
jgi:kumamolisin